MKRLNPFLCLLSLLGVAAYLVTASSAFAVVLHLPGRTLGYQPPNSQSATTTKRASAESKRLTYHGGPVMTSNTNYPLFWAPSGEAAYPAGYVSGIDRWFGDLAHDSGGRLNTDSVLVQYGDSEGGFGNYSSHFGGPLIDTDPYPASGCKAAAVCLTDEQLRVELQSYVEGHALAADLAHEYFVLLPPGVSTCYEASGHQCSEGTAHFKYCAYHSFFKVGSETFLYVDLPYDDTPECVAESPNESPSDYAISGGLAHEHSDTVTDPEFNAWISEKEEEIADKCRSSNVLKEMGPALGTAPDGVPYNQLINGDEYLYQQEWSNEQGACEQRTALPPVVKKIAPKKGPAAGGTRVTVTGSGFLGSVTVDFGATPGTDVKVANGNSLTVLSPEGSGEAVVTVRTEAGVSAAGKKTVFIYKPPKKAKK
ncbi:MAG TPA: IPT/TIG domain-containing protein [Solirubrobacteraceae bacterium]|nr:IPT/TIG domain-containing protein [Solirubrobacteraceae bacterium]